MYQQHIKNQGVLALHISNRHLSLLPVIMRHGNNLNLQVLLFETPGNGNEHDAQWVIMTNNSRLTQSSRLIHRKTVISEDQYQNVSWTDNYSSLLPILKVLN